MASGEREERLREFWGPGGKEREFRLEFGPEGLPDRRNRVFEGVPPGVYSEL